MSHKARQVIRAGFVACALAIGMQCIAYRAAGRVGRWALLLGGACVGMAASALVLVRSGRDGG